MQKSVRSKLNQPETKCKLNLKTFDRSPCTSNESDTPYDIWNTAALSDRKHESKWCQAKFIQNSYKTSTLFWRQVDPNRQREQTEDKRPLLMNVVDDDHNHHDQDMRIRTTDDQSSKDNQCCSWTVYGQFWTKAIVVHEKAEKSGKLKCSKWKQDKIVVFFPNNAIDRIDLQTPIRFF